MFEDAADTAIFRTGHSDVIEGMVFTSVTDVEPGVKQFSNPASKRSELVRDEV